MDGQKDAKTVGPICGIPRVDMPRELRRFFLAGDIIFFQKPAQKHQGRVAARQNHETMEILCGMNIFTVGLAITLLFVNVCMFWLRYWVVNPPTDNGLQFLLWLVLHLVLGFITPFAFLGLFIFYWYLGTHLGAILWPDDYKEPDRLHHVQGSIEGRPLERLLSDLILLPIALMSFLSFYSLVTKLSNSWWYRDRGSRNGMGPLARRASLLSKGLLVVCLTPYPELFASPWLGWFNNLYLTYRAWQRWILADRVFRELEREEGLDRVMFTSVAQLEKSFALTANWKEEDAEDFIFLDSSMN